MADKTKTVIDDMPKRRFFDSVDGAIKYIIDCAQDYADFNDYSLVSPVDASRGVSGVSADSEGNLVFDPEIFSPEMRVMITVLTTRGDGPGSSKVKCIVVAPAPSLDAILADKTGREWLEDRLDTEINRAAVRLLRDGAKSTTDVTDVTILDQMPRTLADYVTSGRAGASTLLEAFEEYWKDIKSELAKASRPWKLAGLPKKEFRNAMASAAYAEHFYPTLEDAPLGKGNRGSLFVIAINAFIALATKAGKDASIFHTWLASRDEAELAIPDEDDEDETELTADFLVHSLATPATEEASTGE